ncbi:uncharacterized protein LOC105383781 [Plutella xylostella]|uniref:uncharacterized protein LOC105383781 n=1 Tax=Plutella xylostella TaxID=51655 RepID=UPI0020321DCF|nr:uncharacterized protein LOC105383781 [Plutella xylostella]
MDRPRNPRARRRLFDAAEEGADDNTVNMIREMIFDTQKQLMEKWNFDPINERPLIEDGPIRWSKGGEDDRYCWIGRVNEDVPEETKDKDEEVDMKTMKDLNEVTPKAVKEDEDAMLKLRKRRKDEEKSCSDKVKRRISFD